MTILHSKFLRAMAGFFLAAASFAASASPIQFIYTGTGSGSLNGNSFSNATFVFSQVGDTSNKLSCGTGCSFIDAISATVSIDGVGSYAFVTGTRTFNYQGLVGFSRAGLYGADLYNVFNVGPTYDLSSAIGPVSGNASLIQWSYSPIVTTAGVLNFADGTSLGSFQAVVAVPEPETYAMILAGLGLLGVITRRRKVEQA